MKNGGERRRHKLVLEGLRRPLDRWQRVLMVAAWVGLTAATAVLLGGGVTYLRYSRHLPDIPTVGEYWPPILSEVLTGDGVLAGEFYYERRKVVPYDQVPKRLVQAFISAEDSRFFDHGGVDYIGTTRALLNTVLRKASGGTGVQGGSTLTQQTAKAVLVSAEMERLDLVALRAEADALVPPLGEPTAEQLAQEIGELRAMKIKRPDSPEEEKLLASDAFQKDAAKAIAQGVREFLDERTHLAKID